MVIADFKDKRQGIQLIKTALRDYIPYDDNGRYCFNFKFDDRFDELEICDVRNEFDADCTVSVDFEFDMDILEDIAEYDGLEHIEMVPKAFKESYIYDHVDVFYIFQNTEKFDERFTKIAEEIYDLTLVIVEKEEERYQ
jgi:hypothetical protein